VELKSGAVTGTAVDIARQIATLAGDGEILVPPTVKDLVAGSGLCFAERDIYRLKGAPDDWRLLSVGP
jgi:class 3 adenylate cyclase